MLFRSVDTVTLAAQDGTVELGDRYLVVVNGKTVSYTATDTDTTIAAVRAGLIAAINGTTGLGVTASTGTGGGDVKLTANTANVAFTAIAKAYNAGIDESSVMVTITGTDNAPVTTTATLTATEDTALNGNLNVNTIATDPESGNAGLTFSLAGGGAPTHGTLTINANGTFTYTPAEIGRAHV